MENYQTTINKYQNSGAHIITPVPVLSEISSLYTAVVDKLFVDSNPDHEDVYSAGNNILRLSGKTITKLGIIAGVIWNTDESGIVEKNNDGCTYTAVGGIRRPDGNLVYTQTHYSLFFDEIEEEIKEECYSEGARSSFFSKKWNKNATPADFENYAASQARKRLRKKKMFSVQIAETGAKNRLIIQLLGLKSSYTKEELKKPFVAIKITFNYNSEDPQVKDAIIQSHFRTMGGLYGEKSVRKLPSPQTETVKKPDYQEADFEDESVTDILSYENIKNLSDKVGYDMDDWLNRKKKSFDELTESEKQSLYDHVVSLDDIPF